MHTRKKRTEQDYSRYLAALILYKYIHEGQKVYTSLQLQQIISEIISVM